MTQALIILSALILGYFIDLKFLSNKLMNKLLSAMISLIIAVMGYNFGELIYKLQGELISMLGITLSFIAALFAINVLAVYGYLHLKPKRAIKAHHDMVKAQSPLKPILTSCKYLLYLVIGTLVGLFINKPLIHIGLIIDGILILILFIIGIQMRREGHSLTQILKNKTGIMIAIILMISSLAVGAILGLFFNIPLAHALMLTSGFGWYSLASILNAQLIDAHFGTMTFFIDFSREIIAIIVIPMLAKRIPTELVSYSGATAMDFSLPVIKDHIGIQAVPVAISSGFVLTLATPILIPLFNLIPF
ncbi:MULTISPECIES: lysine exporter LysO family protein [Cysteiniphilum]|uniref:lysine exporter LysO family protein n=1 Tax=Cysteiniphilum TaxID=2056696 RepID=UPI0017832ED4|nr:MULTISPECIES: LysO family transporter [Cysteiniphilum]